MTKKLVQQTRQTRSLHKKIGIILMVLVLLISISGLLLGIKDEIGLKPPTESVNQIDPNHWISIKKIDSIGRVYAQKQLQLDSQIDRIDIRPSKGIAKILYKKHFTELQIDIQTGAIVSVSTRADHFIERLHDGSIVDFYFTDSNTSKIIYTTLISLGLLFMSISGYLLWRNPIKIKRKKRG